MGEKTEEQELNFFQRLNKVREELKAPKSQYNSFGKYSYRNCEDILEAAKPLCAKYDIFLEIHDELIELRDKPLFKVDVVAFDTINGAFSTKATGYAFMDENKKGMDAAQVCGSASSYARKYALNALFHCDDSKDVDSDAYSQAGEKRKANAINKPTENKKPSDKPVGVEVDKNAKLSDDDVMQLMSFIETEGIEERTILDSYKIKSFKELTKIQAAAICKNASKFLAIQNKAKTAEAEANNG